MHSEVGEFHVCLIDSIDKNNQQCQSSKNYKMCPYSVGLTPFIRLAT